MEKREVDTTETEDYAECKAGVLRAYPSAREVARGLTYVAIKMATRDGGKLREHLLGSGSNANRAWADAYGSLPEEAK